MSEAATKTWIEFVPIPGTEKVRCPRCGKEIGQQRMARGAHAAWCLRNTETEGGKETGVI